uniref:Integrase catalytic domain-containing protein n=1 Tax=Strongyloides papillosus TaxID=174720 RepID=A0A0N5CFS4_STREA
MKLNTFTTIKLLKLSFFLLGFPHTLKTDNGPAFIADLFKNFCKTYNIEHYAVSAYNHQGNGIVERFNRTIRESLRIYKEKDISDIINSTQYVHNFSYTTNQEGKPKEYILSTADRFTNESYTNTTLSGRQNLLQFIKEKLKPTPTDGTSTSKEFATLKVGTIVYKKIVNAHKNNEQFHGPYRILEHLHGDTYLIGMVTRSNRKTGQIERCNARFLKLAPLAIQHTLNDESHILDNDNHHNTRVISFPQETIIKKGRGRPRKVLPTNNETPNTDEIIIQPKKGRGRPKKLVSMNNSNITTIDPQTQQPTRGSGRP